MGEATLRRCLTEKRDTFLGVNRGRLETMLLNFARRPCKSASTFHIYYYYRLSLSSNNNRTLTRTVLQFAVFALRY